MILIVHLSDVHVDKKTNIDISKMISSLPQDALLSVAFIVFSGDFTFHAEEEEIITFNETLGKIKGAIDDKYGICSEILIVPGNHDIFIDGSTNKNDIFKADSKTIKKLYEAEIINEKESIEYCKKFGIDFSENSVCYKTFDTDSSRIHFALVNSAPFSMLGSNDRDKGIHYLIPADYPIRGNPQNGKPTIEILVSHHRPDWFVYESKNALEEFEDRVASLCLYGHEHQCRQKAVDFDGTAIISRGGELKVNHNELTGSFVSFLIDEEHKECEIYKHVFDYRRNQFNVMHFKKEDLRTNDLLTLKDSFTNEIINPVLKDEVNESDLFVMPLLKAFGNQNNIDSFDELMEFLNEKTRVYLFGGPRVGKSILLHRLFEKHQNEAWCIYLDLKSNYSSNIDTAVKVAFESQYRNSDSAFDIFQNSPKEEKIIFVDGFENVKKSYKRTEFMDYLNDKFGKIVIASNRQNGSMKELLGQYFDEDLMFSVCSFSVKQRIAFYENYLKTKNITKENEISSIINAVEASVASCSILDTSDPSYLLPLIVHIFTNKSYMERDTENAFSIIFEHSLRDAILSVSSSETLDDYISIIQLIAYHTVVEKDSAYFDLSDISQCTKARKKDFTHIKLTDDEVLNVLVESRLVCKEEDDYRFERNSYLAYFASLEVIRLFQSGRPKSFEHIMENIVHGINGDIFVFVIYQLKKIDVFYNIHDTLDGLLKNFDEISFEAKNNPILKKNKKLIPETKAQAENKKQLYDRLEKNDRRRIDNARKSEKDAFDDTSDKEINALNKIWKLVEISCKVIAGFSNEIESETRSLFLEKTLSAALKIVNLLFSFKDDKEIEEIEKDFEEKKNKWIELAKERNEDPKRIKKVENLDIVHAMYDTLTTFILNFETSMSIIMSSRVSLPIIADIKEDNFFRKLFKIITYTEAGNFKGFCTQIKPIYDDLEKNKEQVLIVNRVVRVFTIKNGLDDNQRKELSAITHIPQIKLIEFAYNPKKIK